MQILIHDLNSWGGQDRSMMEIAKGLSRNTPIDIHAFTLDSPDFPKGWGQVRFFRVRPKIMRPFILKALIYYSVLWLRGTGKKRTALAVGACALKSRWVQVQFVHAAWHAEAGRKFTLNPRALYARMTEAFNLFTERRLFTPARQYIAIAEVVKQELLRHFPIPEKNIHVIHHGVDPEVFKPCEPTEARERDELRLSHGIRPDETLLLFVGSYERKGLEATLRAVAALAPEIRSGIRLLALGGGDHVLYQKMARELGIADRVILHGVVRGVQRYFRAADVFVLPTVYEPFGLVILEAMSCGLPVIVSARAGGAELVRNGENGLLIKNPRDFQEISGQMAVVLGNPEYRLKLARKARETAIEQSWERVAERYFKLMEIELQKPQI